MHAFCPRFQIARIPRQKLDTAHIASAHEPFCLPLWDVHFSETEKPASTPLEWGPNLQEFSGRWVLEPDPTVQDGVSRATVLRYEVSIVPKWSLPSTIITTVVRCGLPANVRAVAARAEQVRVGA